MPTSEDIAAAAAGLYAQLLRRTHLSKPSDLPTVVVEEARAALGAADVVLYLVNHEHTGLVPVPCRQSPQREVQPLDGSMAGRAFTASTILTAEAEGGRRIWLPLLDGTDRLGALEMVLPVDGDVGEDLTAVCERYAHLVAQNVVSKGLYGDVFEQVQRTRPMTVASELLQAMLPPLTYATDGLVVSAMLEPTYDNGGDAFDYAVNVERTHLAVFDGMGHGLAAAGVTTFALAAYRHARRSGMDLARTYAAIDEAVHSQFAGDRHVTAVLAELDLRTGRLAWISAGHPPPLLLRGGRVVKTLSATPAFPLGWRFGLDVVVEEEPLQPGDLVLFYTDGLIEARNVEHSLLDVEGLSAFLEQEAAAGQPAPETLRRLRRAVLARQQGVLQDDATALLVEWDRGSEQAMMPPTVL